MTFVDFGLLIILLLVLILPFSIKLVEEQLELFLFIMGVSASVISGILNWHLVIDALREPIYISATVLVMGLIFKIFNRPIARGILNLSNILSLNIFIFLVVVVLGLVSSIITVIISSLLLVEIISIIRLDRKSEIIVTIVACFSLGVGAALTPVGEPLSTIAIAKLKNDPYHAGFWFLLKLLSPWVIPIIILLGLYILFVHGKRVKMRKEQKETILEREFEPIWTVFLRAFKVYVFVMALILLGAGFAPVIDKTVLHLPSLALFWLNMISAVLDNATLTAAEISPKMELGQIRDILLGLLISGGMLIPGNIPNIIAANKLKITSREWAKVGVPLGLSVMTIVFIFLLIFS